MSLETVRVSTIASHEQFRDSSLFETERPRAGFSLQPATAPVQENKMQPQAIVFLALERILAPKNEILVEGAVSSSKPTDKVQSLDEQAVEKLQSLITRAAQIYTTVGVVIIAPKKLALTVDALKSQLFAKHAVKEQIIGAIARGETFTGHFAELSLEEPNDDHLIGEWLSKNFTRKVYQLVIIGRSAAPSFPFHFVPAATGAGQLTQADVERAHAVLSDKLFAPQFPSLCLKYQLVKKASEMQELACVIREKRVTTVLQSELIYTFCVRLLQFSQMPVKAREATWSDELNMLVETALDFLDYSQDKAGELISDLALLFKGQDSGQSLKRTELFTMRVCGKAFRSFQKLLKRQDMRQELALIFKALVYCMNHSQFPLQKQFQQLVQSVHSLAPTPLVRVQILGELLEPLFLSPALKELPFVYLLTEIRKKETLHAIKVQILNTLISYSLRPATSEGHKQRVVQIVHEIAADPLEEFTLRQEAATKVLACVHSFQSADLAESQKQTLKALLVIARLPLPPTKALISSILLMKFFEYLTLRTENNPLKQYLFSVGSILLERADLDDEKKVKIVDYFTAKQGTFTGKYVVDFFFFMLEKLKEENLKLQLGKLYVTHIAKIYLNEKEKLGNDLRMPKTDFVEYIRGSIKRSPLLLTIFANGLSNG